jgi:hypothetical protein
MSFQGFCYATYLLLATQSVELPGLSLLRFYRLLPESGHFTDVLFPTTELYSSAEASSYDVDARFGERLSSREAQPIMVG